MLAALFPTFDEQRIFRLGVTKQNNEWAWLLKPKSSVTARSNPSHSLS